MPRIAGLSLEDQLAYLDLIADLLAKPGLDAEIEFRARWLARGLLGNTNFDDMRLAQVAA